MLKPQLIYPLSDLDNSQVALAGGKGASLGELIRSGAPVPEGFVVASEAFRRFLAAADPQRHVERVVQQLDDGQLPASEAAEQIRSILADSQVPDEIVTEITQAAERLSAPRVSVRSSATCEDSGTSAWAGQLDTYLDVSPEDIVARVRDCWLSIFKPSALAYGAVHGYGAGQFTVAVVVQQMVASDISGIGFSVHPVTQEPGLQLIEACFGLGEAIVSGRIVPDQYIVERPANTIVQRFLGNQREGLFMEPGSKSATWRPLGKQGEGQKLTDEQVAEFAALLARIEDHYGHPVDTEWALEEGRFRLLQARPITTLAEEYAEPLVDMSLQWFKVIRRPLSLLEVSIWAHWVDSDHAGPHVDIKLDQSLSIQDDAGMANEFLSQSSAFSGAEFLAGLLHGDRRQLLELLQRGQDVYRDTKTRIERGAEAFADIDEAVQFMCSAAQYTTVIPAQTLMVYERDDADDPQIRSIAEDLRSRSLYPLIERTIIDPLAGRVTKGLGFSAPERTPEVATWSELRSGTLDREVLEGRLRDVEAGRRFVFQSIDGRERTRFVSQTGYLLMRLARQRQVVAADNPDELTGQSAWPGIHQGRARVVLAPDAVGQTIEEGEVLVSIQSSPALMPLLKKCGAIVTDDGGIACHASIIARELRKPTLVGTGRATSVIHTGDLVEVDTYAQVVKILQRATG